MADNLGFVSVSNRCREGYVEVTGSSRRVLGSELKLKFSIVRVGVCADRCVENGSLVLRVGFQLSFDHLKIQIRLSVARSVRNKVELVCLLIGLEFVRKILPSEFSVKPHRNSHRVKAERKGVEDVHFQSVGTWICLDDLYFCWNSWIEIVGAQSSKVCDCRQKLYLRLCDAVTGGQRRSRGENDLARSNCSSSGWFVHSNRTFSNSLAQRDKSGACRAIWASRRFERNVKYDICQWKKIKLNVNLQAADEVVDHNFWNFEGDFLVQKFQPQ